MSTAFSHERLANGKAEWLTPPALVKSLGEFDLDPCSPLARPWDTAKRHLTILDDGLAQPWSGRVWLNPPYGSKTKAWLRKLAEHGNGIALVFACTDTKAFFEGVWGHADAILFLRGRLSFHHVDGTRADESGGPSCLIAYGTANVEALRQAQLPGHLVIL
jgi:hypothetical protein